MNLLERELPLFEKRINRIKSNPDPRKARSNLLYYEAQYERRKQQVERAKAGIPVVDCSSQFMPIFRAMGFEPIDYAGIADRLSATGDAAHYFDRIRQLGYPDYLCDRTIVLLPMVIDGELPPPSFSVPANHGCEAHLYSIMALNRHFNTPHFFLDLPPDEPNLDALEYVTGQLKEMIAVVEKTVPGAKFDEDKLRDIQEAERVYGELMLDIYNARKASPCPEAPQDVFRIPPQPCGFHNSWSIVDYCKARRAEVLERVAKGIGGVHEEKLRIMWTNTAPFHANVFDMLADRGVSVLFFYHGHAARTFGAVYGNVGDEKEFGRKLSPIEEQARLLQGISWGGHAKRWNNHAVKICKDLRIDAVVNFQQEGCVQTIGWQKLMADAMEREVGIPIMHLPGRMLDKSRYDADNFFSRLTGFLDRCIETKQESLKSTGGR